MKAMLGVMAVLVLAAPAYADDSASRLEDILSGKTDEKKDDKGSTSDTGSSSESRSGSSGASSMSSGPIGQKFSLNAGKTVGNGAKVIGANYRGLLGVEAFILAGVGDGVDIGGRVGLQLYPYEGAVLPFGQPVVAGLRFQGLLRFKFVESGRFSLGLNLEPGMFFYFTLTSVQIGILVPAAIQAGLAVSSAVTITAGLDVPFFITFASNTNNAGFPFDWRPHVEVPILIGAGIEYYIRSDLMIFGKAHFGPHINWGNRGGAGLGTDIKAGIGWKF